MLPLAASVGSSSVPQMDRGPMSHICDSPARLQVLAVQGEKKKKKKKEGDLFFSFCPAYEELVIKQMNEHVCYWQTRRDER